MACSLCCWYYKLAYVVTSWANCHPFLLWVQWKLIQFATETLMFTVIGDSSPLLFGRNELFLILVWASPG